MILKKKLYKDTGYTLSALSALVPTGIKLLKAFLTVKKQRSPGPSLENHSLLDPAHGGYNPVKMSDGRLKCNGCMLCVTNCPSKCIAVNLDDSVENDPEKGQFLRREKKVSSLKFDHINCVDCGLCIEACPIDAIERSAERCHY